MAVETSPLPPSVDPKSGFCRESKTFYSLRQAAPLPDESLPLSASAYALSLLPSPLPSNPALIDAATGAAISYPEFVSRVRTLAASLRSHAGLCKGDVAFVLSPTRLDVPLLYFALLSLGVVVSPANPLSTAAEISHQIGVSKPSVAFATAAAADKLPRDLPLILLDSPRFQSFFSAAAPAPAPELRQSEPAAILYSSGTTGQVKGVVLTHRNLVALIAGYRAAQEAAEPLAEGPPVALFPIPLFHVFGFFMALRTVALGETTVLMERFDFGAMLHAVERHRVTYIPVSPPLVVAMAKSDEVARYDLSSLRLLACGGAPLGREVAERFTARFPSIEIIQVRIRPTNDLISH